jgi:uroporphyrin-III C-methyltransferase/precorrin-2 dehydrogenase/sirohydrochlorin ferrochelatase
MGHFPIVLKVEGRRALVVGGGKQAARKAELLLDAGAEVAVVAPALEEDFARLSKNPRLRHLGAALDAEALDGCVLAIGASEAADSSNERLYALATKRKIPVNVVDRPEFCSFTMPAVVNRAPLMVAISTGGQAPILARILRARIETLLPAAYGRLTTFAGTQRARVKDALPDSTLRRRFWERVVLGPVAERLFAGEEAAAVRLMDDAIARAAESGEAAAGGEVYLVGAGPGDPDLLTFRALRLMQQADVVLYDRLIGEGVLKLVRRDAERHYVGKMAQDHTLPQEEIAALLVRLARQGKRVLRLKGGDPFLFGRGGEEIEALAAEGIPFQVVPGITAANGCAAYAGIPLTHRDHAQACIFVTGHGKDGVPELNWESLVQPNQTVAIYMGLSSLAGIAQGFVAHGADPATPAAVIESGTRRQQRVVTATLETLAAAVEEAELHGPALIIVGSVVALRDQLSWFEGAAEAGSAD